MAESSDLRSKSADSNVRFTIQKEIVTRSKIINGDNLTLGTCYYRKALAEDDVA